MSTAFRALVAAEDEGEFRIAFRDLVVDDLPGGEVTVAVAYSSLNYKDGMALAGNKGRVMRSFPMVPGIDLAGTVEDSSSPDFQVGDSVLATGWGLGERHWGGYAQKARVRAEWLTPLPDGLDPRQAMAIGTAGLTAMLSVMALERQGLRPGERPVVVTGAAGGVGGIAVALLSALDYRVAATTGRRDTHDYLRGLGAAEVLARDELATPSGRPLDKIRFAGAIDSVGGETLASVLRQTAEDGVVAACGNASGIDLPTTVLPFILRGVSLLGINSPAASLPARREAWARLARELPKDKLEAMTTVAPLADLPALAADILAGRVRGRTVIDLNA